MLHITAGIFGNKEPAEALAKKLGKAGTVNDIAIYNHGSSEGVFTYVVSNSDKIQTLLQVINMTDVPVLVISELNAAVGEQIIAINEFGFDKGFIILENIDEGQIMPLIKGTCIEKFSLVKSSELVEELKKIKIGRPAALSVPIDNYFNVKSVGTVVLGIMKSGSIKKYDKVVIQPTEKEVMVKGIQSQDKDFESTEPGMRVGLNIKGIEADELKRGYSVGEIQNNTHLMKSKSIKLRFQKSKYSQPVKENDPVFVSAGLQVVAAKVTAAGESVGLECEHLICYSKDTKFLIATTKQSLPRIIGHGTLE